MTENEATVTPGEVDTNADAIYRRPSIARFVAPPTETPTNPLVKDRLISRTTHRSEIGRERQVAGNLPAWDPLPPSEVLTRRNRDR